MCNHNGQSKIAPGSGPALAGCASIARLYVFRQARSKPHRFTPEEVAAIGRAFRSTLEAAVSLLKEQDKGLPSASTTLVGRAECCCHFTAHAAWSMVESAMEFIHNLRIASISTHRRVDESPRRR